MKNGEDLSYYKYAQIGLELAGAVGLGFWAGYRLDARFGSAPWLMLAGAAAGLGAGFFLILRELPREKDFNACAGAVSKDTGQQTAKSGKKDGGAEQ